MITDYYYGINIFTIDLYFSDTNTTKLKNKGLFIDKLLILKQNAILKESANHDLDELQILERAQIQVAKDKKEFEETVDRVK